jgi:hypothetical protein
MNLRVTITDTLHDPQEIGGPPLIGRERAVATAAAAPHSIPAQDLLKAHVAGREGDRVRAITNTNRTRLRRWAISAGIVLLVHGAIVAAVVTWRKTVPFGPIVIDLEPAPAVSVVPTTGLPPEQARPNAAPEKPIDRAADKVEKTPASVDEKAGQRPTEGPRVTVAPGAEAESMPDTSTAPGGGSPSATRASPTMSGPIDLVVPNRRPTEQKGLLGPQYRLRFDKAEKARNEKGAVFGRPSNLTARHLHAPAAGAANGVIRNAAGLPVQVPASVQSGATRNAIGMLVQGSAGARGVGGVTVNHVHGTATNPIAQAGAVGARAAINGTGMGARPRTGTGLIGGPASKSTGVLNGTEIKPRHP